MRHGRLKRTVIAGLALAMVAAGCGGGDDAEPDEAPAEDTEEPAETDDTEADPEAEDEEAAEGEADVEVDEAALAEHFEGETINFIVGFGPGGAYDVHARILAEHMAQYIPGEPDIVIQNIPGGVSLNGAREMANSDPDGLTLAVYSSNLNFQELVGVEVPGLVPSELVQLGTALNWWGSIPMWCTRTDVAESFEDLMALDRPIRWAQPSLFPAAAFLETTDLPFENVLGYDGMASVVQAVDSAETDGTGWCTTETVDTLAPQWIEEESVMPVFYAHDLDLLDGAPNEEWHAETGIEQPPMLKELFEFTDEQLEILELVSLEQFTSTQNVAAPAGTPEDITQALREAIRMAAESEEFQAAMVEAERVPGYRSAEEILEGQEAIRAYPDEVKEAVRMLFEE